MRKPMNIYRYFPAITAILLCCTFISCAGGGGASDSTSSDRLSINIKTQKDSGRAASNVAYTFTITLSGSYYSKTATKTGNPVKFHFDDVPVDEDIDVNVNVKLGSVQMFIGSKVINIGEGENNITIDLSNTLEDTIQVPYSEVNNIKTILCKSTAETPTIILTGSNSDMSAVVFQIKEASLVTGKKVNLNLLNTTKKSYDLSEIAIFNIHEDYLNSVQLPEGSSIEETGVFAECITCSKPTIKIPSGSNYIEVMKAIAGNEKLTNITLDYNNAVLEIPRLQYTASAIPTNITAILLTGVQKLGQDAFKEWTGLAGKTVRIPASLTHIGSHSFDVKAGNDTGGIRLSYEHTTGWSTSNGSAPSANAIRDASYTYTGS